MQGRKEDYLQTRAEGAWEGGKEEYIHMRGEEEYLHIRGGMEGRAERGVPT